jgi:integrase
MKLVDRKQREPNWKGEKRYFIDYRDQNGKRKTPGFKFKEDAEREFGRLQRLKERGWHPSAEAVYITFGQAMDAYLKEEGIAKFSQRRNRKDKWEASTLALFQGAAENHIRPAVGHLTLAQLEKNPQPLQNLVDKLSDHVRTPEVVKSVISGTIIFAFKRKRWLTHNFLLDHEIVIPTRRRKERAMLTANEFEALKKAIGERKPNEKRYAWEYRQLIFALCWTGGFMRRGEMAALHWEDIQDGLIHIHRAYSYQHYKRTGEWFKETKTGKDRWAPLEEPVRDALILIWKRQGQPKAGLIMRSPSGKPIYGQMREGYFLYTAKKAGLTIDNGRPNGIGKVTLHDQRHYGESLHIAAGAYVKQIAARAGHSEDTLRKTYHHHLPDDDTTARVGREVSAQLKLPAPKVTVGDYQAGWRARKAGNSVATEATKDRPKVIEIPWVKEQDT